MKTQVSYCPICGVGFEHTTDSPDSRATAAYKCERCNQVLEVRVNQFPLA